MTCNDQSPAALLAAACQQESGSSLGAGLGQLDHAVDDDQRDLESERPQVLGQGFRETAGRLLGVFVTGLPDTGRSRLAA
ncbi:MAG: hypothetical protein WAL71_02655 [Terriglobales bacterium]|jgi:hypothetical protein